MCQTFLSASAPQRSIHECFLQPTPRQATRTQHDRRLSHHGTSRCDACARIAILVSMRTGIVTGFGGSDTRVEIGPCFDSVFEWIDAFLRVEGSCVWERRADDVRRQAQVRDHSESGRTHRTKRRKPEEDGSSKQSTRLKATVCNLLILRVGLILTTHTRAYQ